MFIFEFIVYDNNNKDDEHFKTILNKDIEYDL